MMTSMTMIKFNDQVEAIHLSLLDNDEYRAFLAALDNKQAVEGSLFDDDVMAAKMIREQAAKLGYVEVAQAKLTAIVKALRVVLRRYGMSRKERRRMSSNTMSRSE
jgi:hypothetical protein